MLLVIEVRLGPKYIFRDLCQLLSWVVHRGHDPKGSIKIVQIISYVDTRRQCLCLLPLSGWHDVSLKYSVVFLLLFYLHKWKKLSVGGNVTNRERSKGCSERKEERNRGNGEEGREERKRKKWGKGMRLLFSLQDPLWTVCLRSIPLLGFHVEFQLLTHKNTAFLRIHWICQQWTWQRAC